jgi:drug/metabolite transporter (DMT)-like permease
LPLALAPHRHHPYLAAAAAAMLAGATLPAMRLGLLEAAPAQLALLRYAIAAACLLLVLAGAPAPRRPSAQPRGDWLGTALVDFGQFGVLMALLAFGLRYTSATRAGLLFACFPLIVLLLGTPAWTRQPGRGFLLGVGLCAAGVLLALADGAYVRSPRHAWLGEASVFICVALGALCSMLYRSTLSRYAALPVAAGAMAASVALLILLAGAGWTEGLRLSPRGWVIVLYLGGSCAAAHVLWQYALAHAPAARLLPLLACTPLASAFLGAYALRERQSVWLLAGLACMVAGLVLALRAAPAVTTDAARPAER